MKRSVTTNSTDQSIRVFAYNSSGDAITGEAYNSAGIAVSVVVRSAGRILSTTALTLVARSGAGVHTESAFTEVGSGEYVVDLADTYLTTANRQVSVTLTSTAISGGYVLSETLDVGVAAELDSASLTAIRDGLATAAAVQSVKDDTGATLPAQNTAIYNRLGVPAGASIAADIAGIESGGGGGGESLLLSTTIAAVTSQTVLVLTEGTGENDAYNDMLVVITDSETATQKARAIVSDYVGASKTLTLAAAPSFTVAVGDTIAIIAVSGRTTEFTGAALTKLNTIQSSVVMQTGATGYSVVRPGGRIVLKAGDDYADDIVTTISLPVTDADEVVYDRLTAGDTATIKFAAGRNRQKNLIVGTVTKADVTKAAGVTYVPIEIARAQLVASTDSTTNRVYNDYKYDIQVTTSGGKVTTPVGGELEVEFDNAD